jgi:aminocarboxymuconate-semialdehyde decarboxylase
MIDDTVNGRTYDYPAVLRLWKVAEPVGAVMCMPQWGEMLVRQRSACDYLPNTIGNVVDRAVPVAAIVFGGVMDRCPDLRVCRAYGGSYTCDGIGRMDRGWQVRSGAWVNGPQPPSASLSQVPHDGLTHSEEALRDMIDPGGIDRVVFGTDGPVSWLWNLESLSQAEQVAIRRKTLEKRLGF